MTNKRILAWPVVVIMALVPFNLIRLWVAGEVPPGATAMQFVS